VIVRLGNFFENNAVLQSFWLLFPIFKFYFIFTKNVWATFSKTNLVTLCTPITTDETGFGVEQKLKAFRTFLV
jgi:hypothetical protein